MRGKKAKEIREIAKAICKGKFESKYTRNPETGQITLTPCFRSIYKPMKAWYKKKGN